MEDGPIILNRPARLPVTRDLPVKTPSLDQAAPEGLTRLGGEDVYCIPDYDRLPPFLISVVSDSDLWMYVSSRGGLAAGRCSADRALFAYETDDRLHHLAGTTGPTTLIRVEGPDTGLWEPFAGIASDGIRRNLYKSTTGDSLTFEEINARLGLSFRYTWHGCHRFGFVRSSTLINHLPATARSIQMIDGLLNLQPAGVPLRTQQSSSCLVDAYKCAEVDRETKLAIYSLSALVSDRPEPAECLRASVAWCRGLPAYRVVLSDSQLAQFRRGNSARSEARHRGERGSFLVSATLQVRAGQAISWDIVADTHLSQAGVSDLRRWLLEETRPHVVLRDQLNAATDGLRRLVAASDGLQATASGVLDHHHFANVLFNIMRGGVMCDEGRIGRDDLIAFIRSRNLRVADRHAALLRLLPDKSSPEALDSLAAATGDPNLRRLIGEYLPLTFARRHGDPSRPWNRFEIRAFNPDGSRAMDYAGNWRDIFQNWEALCRSFPAYLPRVISKFVNATTVDGFNAYRIGRGGIDWETPDPEDPWSNIGYWGDHQIAYLTCFLEACGRTHPGLLAQWLRQDLFTWADVPYRLKSFDEMRCDPRNTIVFDRDHHYRVMERARAIGSDGRLVHHSDGSPLHVNLTEKLLVPILAKLGSLVPGGGVWMNTQRPEWNDANNALAAHGLSVVTACYLYRHLKAVIELVASSEEGPIAMSSPVVEWVRATNLALRQPVGQFFALGEAFSRYRTRVYLQGLGPRDQISRNEAIECLTAAVAVLEQTIRANQRSDSLFHAYNLLHLPADANATEITIEHLPEMLEGQVAAIASGILTSSQCLQLVNALYNGPLYRADQQSFMLYPDAPAVGFMQKNRVPEKSVRAVGLLTHMLEHGDHRIIRRDAEGVLRFNPDFSNETDLRRRLDELKQEPALADLVARDRQAVRDAYEATFNHHAFTGRSCAMFAYEGLGSIYWHMVAKLLVAVQEQYFRAIDAGEPRSTVELLADAYYRIRGGMGFNKTARDYGAFPTDPYSHTPGHAGARQPGMTGQVKEVIIARFGELGVRVAGGVIRFSPTLLDAGEFSPAPVDFQHLQPGGGFAELAAGAHALAFTYCGVPVVYRIDETGPRIVVARTSGEQRVIAGDELDAASAADLLARNGQIQRLVVSIPASALRNKQAKSSIPVDANGKNTPAAGAAGGE